MAKSKNQLKCCYCKSSNISIYKNELLAYRIKCDFCNAETNSLSLGEAKERWKKNIITCFKKVKNEE